MPALPWHISISRPYLFENYRRRYIIVIYLLCLFPSLLLFLCVPDLYTLSWSFNLSFPWRCQEQRSNQDVSIEFNLVLCPSHSSTLQRNTHLCERNRGRDCVCECVSPLRPTPLLPRGTHSCPSHLLTCTVLHFTRDVMTVCVCV